MQPFVPFGEGGEGHSSQPLRRGQAFAPIPPFPPHLIQSARLYPSREFMVTQFAKGGVVAEVGTQHGYFARHIMDVLQPDALHVFDIDFAPLDESGLLNAFPNVTRHLGNSPEMMAALPDAYFDWIYIDGDHTYEGVKADLHAAAAKLKPGGFLALNDFTYWSVLELDAYGVATATVEFCVENAWEVTGFALEPWMYCDIVIRPTS